MAEKKYNFSRMTMLILDDNSFICYTIAQMCYGFGFERITRSHDPGEALEILKTSHVDFVVCDLSMRPINGIEFTRMVRCAPDTNDPLVPIIMLTGHSDSGIVKEARDAGVTEFLVKPVSAKSLLSRVVSIIEKPRQFIKERKFIGPDRRRRTDPISGPERRKRPQY